MFIAVAILISGWAVYKSACFLAADLGNFDLARQQIFNNTLRQYLWIIIIVFIITSGLLHFYSTRRLIKPIRSLIQSTRQLKRGYYPEPVKINGQDEIAQLATLYNELIEQLHLNEQQRKKLVTDLSHEIRTPLSNISGYLQALANNDLIGDEQLFSSLYQETRRLTKMLEQLDQLKDWDHVSSQSLITMDNVEIKELLEQCIKLFEWTLEQKGISLKLEVEACNLPVHIKGIQQVMSNLLDNAICYYDGYGPIVIKGRIEVDCYRITVTGPSRPITNSDKDRVFTRFYRLDSSRSRDTGGTGLGLAITKEIIEAHNGKIGIESEKNGNTFWFELPL